MNPWIHTRHRSVVAAALALALLAPAEAAAQAPYPSRPVRIVVPYPPGGGADTVSRILFGKLAEVMGQQMVIDNRPGGSGTIGAGAVAHAAPDGYTLLHDATAHSVNPWLFASLPYDTTKAFEPIFQAVLVPNLLLVHPAVPVRGVGDLIALAKATPGGIDMASSGNGTAQHLALELLRQMTGIPINHVPYRGGGPALNDLISGQIRFFFSNATSSTGHVRAGTVKAIAHSGRDRLVAFPDLPAVADTLPGFECYEWNGVFAPAGTPQAIVRQLNAALNQVIRQPDVARRLTDLNATIGENTPEQFRAFVAAEIVKWGKVVREGNIRIE